VVNLPLAVEIAQIPDEIKGYGYIKETNMTKAAEKLASLLKQFTSPAAPVSELIAAE
jgi:indolepyruvate ferredoxin oxidoreductase